MGVLSRRIGSGALLLVLCVSAVAQRFSGRPLITRPVAENQLVTLKGNTHPMARPISDMGIAPSNLPLQRMLLVLKRDPQQDFALTRLLDDQQDRNSSKYHKWLTPDEFGVQFGPSDADLQIVTGWLQTHGLQIDRIARGRTVVEFSGTEAQVEDAFHTQLHKYLVNGKEHWANASDPQIPAALAPAVAGVWGLHTFFKTPMSVRSPQQFGISRSGISTLATGNTGHHFLMPGDYSIIYNINPLYTMGIQGQGATIAVVARSNVNISDIYQFHSVAGLNTFFNTILDGPDPGIYDQGEEAEAVLDLTWSSSLAPSAQTNFVVSESTNTTDGVDLSELYIIDNNLGDVMTESFGSCEGFASQAEAQGLSSLAQQAAAQGITYMVSSGDSGAEGCADPNTNSAGGMQPSVNVLASSPYDVSVGGTIFNEGTNSGQYWLTTNRFDLTSVKSYIPENVWNESCSTCGLWAGGGGPSTFFPKPNWQAGVPGIPNDAARDQPDVSLTAAGHDPYLLCFEGSCNQGFLIGISGTSASAPSFAGIMALIVQQYGRQGQANYTLYRLAAAETYSKCNGSNTAAFPAANCIFNDVTKGSNAVPGEAGFGTTAGKYQATAGYDLATGLGSVNVANLWTKWPTVTFNATNTTLTPASINGTHGNPVTVNVAVAPGSGSGVPTGDVSLLAGSGQGISLLKLNNGSVSSPINNLPGGSYSLTGRYSGDATFAPSTSAGVQVNILAENSATTISAFTADQSGNPIPFTGGTYGGFVYLRADVSGQSGHGIPSGNVTFFDHGNIFWGPTTLNSLANTSAIPNGFASISGGQHSFTAHYNSDSSFNASTSPPLTFTIAPASTTNVLSAASIAVIQGGSINLISNLSSPAFGTYPTGIVTFFSGGTQIGTGQVFGLSSQPSGVTAYANLSTANLPLGQQTISAQYSGDSNYAPSNAAPITITVQADFSFSAASSALTISAPGGSATNALSITGQTGYNSTINFTNASCTGLPSLAKCTFSPAGITGSGSTTLTISTTAATAKQGNSGGLSGLIFACAICGGMIPKSKVKRKLFGLVLVAGCYSLWGCGGGAGGGSGGGGGGSPGTPPGSYSVVVTASTAAVNHTSTFTLTVN